MRDPLSFFRQRKAKFFENVFSPRNFQTALTLLIFSTALFSQTPTYTANDQVTPYEKPFRPGYNPGYFPGWNDQTLGNLAAGNPTLGIAGVGAKSVRQGLFYELLDTWGFGVRLPEIQHYNSLGMGEYVGLILGGANGGSQPYPPDNVRDLTEYCPGHPSDLFANLYKPIWDGGANGTPYQDDNYFAAYLWETVNTYKDHVRFWEIWNEPGFDYTGDTGWRPKGDPAGNWWDQNPDPCDYRLRAPIFHYVRMLRIAWEVVKSLDPDSYVCLSSPGYQSFLDAILRNTDNPTDGSLTNQFPRKGGAYFDALTFHAYPHFDGSTVLDPTPPAKYMRNSDRCADGVVDKRNYFQIVLNAHGYDGSDFPKKEFIVTEINLPRKSFGNPAYFGSAAAQRNFVMKAFVNAKINRLHQLHFYTLAELKKEADANYEFDLMGLYKNIVNLSANSVEFNEEGIALKTVSDLLFGTTHDAAFSATLQSGLPIRAEAFQRPDGKHVVAVWAKTQTDLSELASATFAFPPGTFFSGQKYEWGWSQTGTVTPFNAQSLPVTGTPVFLVGSTTVSAGEVTGFSKTTLAVSPNPVDNQAVTVSFELQESSPTELFLVDQLGRRCLEIFHGEGKPGLSKMVFGTEGLAAGAYFLILKTEAGAGVQKIMVLGSCKK